MKSVFCVKHWGVGGEGSGSSIVVASSARMAAEMVRIHLTAKPDGYRQFTSVALLEVESLEDSTFAGDCLSTSQSGVILEYWFKPGEETYPELVFVGFDKDKLAAELMELQAKHNGDRGVSCVRTLCSCLQRGRFSEARAVANNEGDKIRSYPDIVEVLKRVGFWHELTW